MDKEYKLIIGVVIVIFIIIAIIMLATNIINRNNKAKNENVIQENEIVQNNIEQENQINEIENSIEEENIAENTTIENEITQNVVQDTYEPIIGIEEQLNSSQENSDDEIAIQLVKDDWKETENVSFNIANRENNIYMISVNNKETTEVLQWYRVDIETKQVTKE